MKTAWVILTFVAICGVEKAYSQNEGWGSLRGRIVLDGPIPLRPNLAEKGAAACVVKAIPDETIIVGKNGGLKNCFVYLYQREGTPLIHPKLKTATRKKVELEAKECRFVPHTLIIKTNQRLNVISRDAFEHSIHTFPIRNAGVNMVVPVRDQQGIDLKFSTAEPLPMTVVCDLHPWMSAKLFIVDHPYAVLTDENGNFNIERLPAGPLTFRIWHEAYGYIKFNGKRDIKIEIPAGQTAPLGVIKLPAKSIP